MYIYCNNLVKQNCRKLIYLFEMYYQTVCYVNSKYDSEIVTTAQHVSLCPLKNTTIKLHNRLPNLLEMICQPMLYSDIFVGLP